MQWSFSMRISTILPALAFVSVIGAAAGAFAQTMPSQSPNDKFVACRGEGRAAGLSGDALKRAVDDCLRGPAVRGFAASKQSYADCRAAAISQGLSGEKLGQYVARCTTTG
jgi:hypothetical protein